jgi:hypothetical protein
VAKGCDVDQASRHLEAVHAGFEQVDKSIQRADRERRGGWGGNEREGARPVGQTVNFDLGRGRKVNDFLDEFCGLVQVTPSLSAAVLLRPQTSRFG